MEKSPENRALSAREADPTTVDAERWMRDSGVLFALPAIWIDHDSPAIVESLLGVLCSILQLDGAYARVDLPGEYPALESWRPATPRIPPEFLLSHETSPSAPFRTVQVVVSELGEVRVARLTVSLPRARGLVLTSSTRSDFPTATEAHIIRVAVSQAAISIHSANALLQEQHARFAAEAAALKQSEALHALIDDVEPFVATISRSVLDAARIVTEVAPPEVPAAPLDLPVAKGSATLARRRDGSGRAMPIEPLTPREREVLGLLAQGLSNREIASLIWLSARTVERHVTSLYRKIGVARRSEATAFAFRHGEA